MEANFELMKLQVKKYKELLGDTGKGTKMLVTRGPGLCVL